MSAQIKQSRYGFEENFENSQYSEESEDMIIVEPLNPEQSQLNQSKNQRLTGSVLQSTAQNYGYNKSIQQSVNRSQQPQVKTFQPPAKQAPKHEFIRPTQPVYATTYQPQGPQPIEQSMKQVPIQQTKVPVSVKQLPSLYEEEIDIDQQDKLRQSIPNLMQDTKNYQSTTKITATQNNIRQSKLPDQKEPEKEILNLNERRIQAEQFKEALLSINLLKANVKSDDLEEKTKVLYNAVLQAYVNHLKDAVKSGISSYNALLSVLLQFRYEILWVKFVEAQMGGKNQYYDSYKIKLVETINEKERLAIEYFSNISQIQNESYLDKQMPQIRITTIDSFIKDFNSLLDNYQTNSLEIEQTSAFVESAHKHYPRYLTEIQQSFLAKNPNSEASEANVAKLAIQVQAKEAQLQELQKKVDYQEKKNQILGKQIENLQEEKQIDNEEVDNAQIQYQFSDQEDRIYKLKQDYQAKNSEVGQLKKAIVAQQNKNKEDEGCILF